VQLRGVAEWGAAMTGLVASMDVAVRKSVNEGAYLQKKMVRANMGGSPRWDAQRHINYPRGGGPGEVTGKLRSGVGYIPIVRRGFGHYSTILKAKRKYAAKVERQYPYFTPAVRESTPAVDAVFLRNYAAVIARA